MSSPHELRIKRCVKGEYIKLIGLNSLEAGRLICRAEIYTAIHRYKNIGVALGPAGSNFCGIRRHYQIEKEFGVKA
jgi:hypothetical protein